MFTLEQKPPGISFLNSDFDEFFSYVDMGPWSNLSPEQLKEVRQAIKNIDNAPLTPNTPREEYLSYLEGTTGLTRDNPNAVSGLQQRPQKAIAHTLLAFAGLTELEAHLMPLTDLSSILSHAKNLYNQGVSPWFDLVVENDYVKKSDHDIIQKNSAPLFRDKDCPTYISFAAKVLPAIFATREKEPNACIKIFPQSKNVETFNIAIHRNRNNTTTWIVEWYPGAYTPRDGEDASNRTVEKNRAISKEERIVRTIIDFDQSGKAVAHLKSAKNHEGQSLPFNFPSEKLNINQLFQRATIIGNHDDMIASNDPFLFLKYITTHPQFNHLIITFDKVHAQLGYGDLVVSGMIGPEIVFAMDIDIESPPTDKTDLEYVIRCLHEDYQPPHTNEQLLHHLHAAPILHELDRTSTEITQFASDLLQLLADTSADGWINISLLYSIALKVGLLEIGGVQTDFQPIYLPHTPMASQRPERAITPRERLLIQSMLSAIAPLYELDKRVHQSLDLRQQTVIARQNRVKPTNYIKPTHLDVLNARFNTRKPSNSIVSPKTVADL